MPLQRLGQLQPTPVDGQVLAGWNRVDGVALDPHLIFGLGDLHAGVLGEDVGHMALVSRFQVLDDYESHPAVGGHRLEEVLEGIQPARRRTDAHNR